MQANNNVFKVVLCGEANVGKSTYVASQMDPNLFNEKYVSTVGVEVHPVKVDTTQGRVTLNIWDVAGKEKFQGLMDGYFIGAHMVIVMCSTLDKISISKVFDWISLSKRLVPNASILVVCNKAENTTKEERESIANRIQYDYVYPLIFISAKENVNVKKPLLHVIRKLLNNESIQLA